jgi:hypothetical protein
MEERMSADEKYLERFKAYEDGKHRRYSLLFTVNGGAFAVAKLFADAKILSDPKTAKVLGSLTLCQLSFGMILFTALMTFDIYIFGHRMRRYILEEQTNVSIWQGPFSVPGKVVLVAIGALICVGWWLVTRS